MSLFEFLDWFQEIPIKKNSYIMNEISTQRRRIFKLIKHQMIYGNFFMKQHQKVHQSVVKTLRHKFQKTNVFFMIVFLLSLQLIVPFLLKNQTINFLTQIVHLTIAAVIQIVDLSTLNVIVRLFNTEHAATNQEQIQKKDIIH